MLTTVPTLQHKSIAAIAEVTRLKPEQIRRHRKIITDIFELPKVDLHVHLGGSLRVSTIIDLAQEQGIALPTTDPDRFRTLVSRDRYPNLEAYLKYFPLTESVLQTVPALERGAYEIACDMAAENVWYCELRFSPMNYTHRGLRPHEVIHAVARGLERAQQETGIVANMILCSLRIYNQHMSPYHKKIARFFSCFTNKQLAQEVARNTAVAAVNARQVDGLTRVVGFDIAGPEKGYPAKNFAESFQLITKAGLYNTCHAGEGFGWESIKQALVDCHVDRIGHGTHLLDSDMLVEYCAGMRRVPIEVCLTSNAQTTPEFANYKNHPVREFRKRNLRVILCTDNRLISNTTKTKECYLAWQHHDFSLADLAAAELNGLKSAFMHSNTRRTLIPEFITRVRKRFKLGF
ncbi:MAG TPA: adenosine deaminase family protein [bacterium]|nr:adenosine deaminase family protein [bacterium]